jgi:glycosidase
MRRIWPVLAASLLGFGLVPIACASGLDYASGPGGTGGFDPGDGGLTTSSSGYGANGQGTAGVGGDPGPPQCDDELKQCPHEFTYPAGNESSVELRGSYAPDGWTTGTPLTKDGDVWRASVYVPWNVDVEYKFVLDGVTWVEDPNNANHVSDGFGGFNSLLTGQTCSEDEWICVTPFGTFDWRSGVLYFVFVDRFNDGDPSNNGAATAGVQEPADWQGGDWAGVLQKVEDGYFTSLGVNVLWLSVPMDNTSQAGQGIGGDTHEYSAYHGYWPSNLDQAEEHFGSLEELKALVDAAHAKGIKIILDYAMNHVHVSSPVYTEHKDWFWSLADCGVCGQGCNWDGPSGKKCWFTDYLPDFNFTVAAARQYSVDNALWWIEQTGIDGFRLDAVKHIENSWVQDLRAAVKAQVEPVTGEHFYMVGETFSYSQNDIRTDPVTGVTFVDPVNMLDGQFDFPVRLNVTEKVLRREGSMTDLDAFFASNDAFYGAGVMSTFVGNHDIPRVIHQAEDSPPWSVHDNDKDRAWNNPPSQPSGKNAFERLANAFTILFTTKGIPLVYYGDEIGLPGAGDPDNRRMMQWSGYSAGQTLLLDHMKKLGAIRAAHPALWKGTRAKLSATTDTYAYVMSSGDDTVYVAINRSDADKSVDGLPASALKDLLTDATVSGPALTVKARSGMVLVAP